MMAARMIYRSLPSRRLGALAFHKRLYSSATGQTYNNILVDSPRTGVGRSESLELALNHFSDHTVTLNRPRALNALSTALFEDLNAALRDFDSDSSTGAIVLTGSEKAFAAGADIKEMQDLTYSDAVNTDFIASWSATIPNIRKPIIAAVNGHALGGGCELALMADVLYCSASAAFGQPEIKLGIIPGAGGSQRLTAAVGKSRAMELILTGKTFSGTDAERWGVAAKCFPTAEECVDGALGTAEKIAAYSRVAVRNAKEVVNKSQNVGLREGLEYERKVFHGMFGSQDQKIGGFLQTGYRSY